jgi:putative ABC transport system permease protein
VPFSAEGQRSYFHIVGAAEDRARRPGAYMQIATTRYFATMGIPLVKGRAFAETDRAGGHPVLVVNEALAKRYFPGGDAIGKTLTVDFASDTDAHGDTASVHGEIVGVVGDTKLKDVTLDQGPALYAANEQFPSNYLTFVVRTRSEPATVLRATRQAVAAIDPSIPIFATGLLADDVSRSLAAPRLTATVVAAFALTALILTVIGIYGVLAYAVRERRRELGIRMALGAREGQVVSMVVGQGIRLAAIGLGLGFALALMGGRALAALLYGVSADDPLTYEAVAAALLAVAALASWLPARRAAVIDPVIAMRPE